MTHMIEVSDGLYARLQSRAKPFVDTPETIIALAMDALEAANGTHSAKGVGVEYDPAAPPNLTHTKVLSAVLNSKQLAPDQTYWNHLLDALLLLAAQKGKKPHEVKNLAVVNAVIGEKTVNGYRFIPEAGVSVQGQDANGAWKGINNLATALGASVQVKFAWYENPKAAHPGETGLFSI